MHTFKQSTRIHKVKKSFKRKERMNLQKTAESAPVCPFHSFRGFHHPPLCCPSSSALPLLVSFSNFPESTGSFSTKHLPVNSLRTKTFSHYIAHRKWILLSVSGPWTWATGWISDVIICPVLFLMDFPPSSFSLMKTHFRLRPDLCVVVPFFWPPSAQRPVFSPFPGCALLWHCPLCL